MTNRGLFLGRTETRLLYNGKIRFNTRGDDVIRCVVDELFDACLWYVSKNTGQPPARGWRSWSYRVAAWVVGRHISRVISAVVKRLREDGMTDQQICTVLKKTAPLVFAALKQTDQER